MVDSPSCSTCKSTSHTPTCTPTTKGGATQHSTTHAKVEARPKEKIDVSNPHQKPFTAIYNDVFLHDRSEEQTFQLLIDALRLRQEDEWSFDGIALAGTICTGANTSEQGFRNFILKAKDVPGFLPPVWTDESLEKCIDYSRRSTKFSLAMSQKKHDIQKTWKDESMPMKLRMMAEPVYGYGPAGSKRDHMLAMLMRKEGGDSAARHSTTIDLAALMRGLGSG